MKDDTISRQAAVEAVGINTWAGYRLKNLPSVQPEPRWIPVEENLPPSQEEVIVSVCDETGDTKYNYTSHGWLTGESGYWIVDDEINNYVVAWMPLPKPYERSKE